MTAGSNLMTHSDDFMRAAQPFRGDLLAHCYRMLGSVHEAEDLVQETYLRAWRAYERFEGRSSLRTWLYRIATTACLRALEQRSRRPLPSGLGAPGTDVEQEMTPDHEIPWLQPLPDSLIAAATDPAAVAVSRESTRLAFVAALQHLSARQRAVLILRDVLRWRAAEVADLLGSSVAAVNSALQRARAELADVRREEDLLLEPTEPERRDLLDRVVAAFEKADVDGLVSLLRDDVVLEMPPHPVWFVGVDDCARFLAPRLGSPGDLRMLPTSANHQPALGLYHRVSDGTHHAHGIIVLTLTARGIARMTAFLDPSLAGTFGLPSVLGA